MVGEEDRNGVPLAIGQYVWHHCEYTWMRITEYHQRKGHFCVLESGAGWWIPTEAGRNRCLTVKIT